MPISCAMPNRLGDPGKKGTGPICAKHPPGRSGKLDLSPFFSERQKGFEPSTFGLGSRCSTN